ncbi:DUF2800 domain-containing protein [Serratia rubidaea]|nr:DUF2800 domain-containing protein [Serratia rubidaea]
MDIEEQNAQSQVLEDFEVISTPLDLPVADFLEKVPLLTPEQLAEVFSHVDRIEAVCEAVRYRVGNALKSGQMIPGFKLVAPSSSDPEWSNTAEAEELLKSFRLKQDQMYNQTVITPSQAEELLKKDSPRRWTKVEALITHAEGEPIVAPESDPRPAMNIKPENDFNDVSDDAFAESLI